jgi:hypothetical protein
MSIALNHTIVWCRDQAVSAQFLVGGRGVYFRDPDDHLLEIITRPYDRGAVPG